MKDYDSRNTVYTSRGFRGGREFKEKWSLLRDLQLVDIFCFVH